LGFPLAAQTLKISVVGSPSNPFYQPFLSVVQKAFHDEGLTLEFISYPGIRGLIEANNGTIDGDLARMPSSLGSDFPNLLPIPEPVAVADNCAYALKAFPIKTIDDIGSLGLSVATTSSLRWAEQVLKPKVAPGLWNATPEYDMAVKMLLAKRVDLLIATDLAIKPLLKDHPEVQQIAVLNSVEDYMYLNKRWASRLDALAEHLRNARH
jgi:hypothetical protein